MQVCRGGALGGIGLTPLSREQVHTHSLGLDEKRRSKEQDYGDAKPKESKNESFGEEKPPLVGEEAEEEQEHGSRTLNGEAESYSSVSGGENEPLSSDNNVNRTNNDGDNNNSSINNRCEGVWFQEFGRNSTMLLWKRAVCALRDIKGLTYEILVPIMTICLVLLILKLNVNPAGPSIELSADLYSHHCADTTKGETIDDPEALMSPASTGRWQQLSKQVEEHFSGVNSAYTLVPTDLDNSLNVSYCLLDEVHRHNRKSSRIDAFVANDTVTITVSDKIKEAVDTLAEKIPDALRLLIPLVPNIPKIPHHSPYQQLHRHGHGFGFAFPELDKQWKEEAEALVYVQGAAAENSTDSPTDTHAHTDSPAPKSSTSTPTSSPLAHSQSPSKGPSASVHTTSPATSSPATSSPSTSHPTQNPSLATQNPTRSPATEVPSSAPTVRIDPVIIADKSAHIKAKVGATILHNSTYLHALPVGLAELHDAQLKAAKGPDAYLRVRNHPLPLSKILSLYIDTILTLFAAIFLLLPFCYLPGTLAMFWVKERELRVKHVHFVSGVTPLQYWLTAFLWDVMIVGIIDVVFIVVLICYGNDEFIGTFERACATYFLIFAYGMSVVPLSLLLSFLFNSASSSQVGIAAFHFVSGFVLLIVASILEAIPSTYNIAVFLKYTVFRMLPPFVLGEGLIRLSVVALFEEVIGTHISPWGWDGIGRSLTYLLATSVFYFLMVLAVDSKSEIKAFYRCLVRLTGGILAPPRALDNSGRGIRQGERQEMKEIRQGESIVSSDEQDEYVREEAEEVEAYLNALESSDDQGIVDETAAIAIHRLTKVYPPMAVDRLSLLVPSKQCFGLLGVNGAGKSTTLKILTADVEPTSGAAFVNGISVHQGVRAIRKQLGYCPQFNPLLPAMTVAETLMLYARLRGLTSEFAKVRIARLIEQLRLGPHIQKQCGALSGGNKRKVSLAIALVGDPPVLFLDEPSSGMDPVTRRYMWDMIAELGRKRCVVLTTHSMEECEALCHRVGIMSKGRLRCLGTLQQLKNRHGKGYHLEVSCSESKVEEVHSMLDREFTGMIKLEEWGGKLKLRLPDPNISLASIFRILEGHKKKLGITDYSVSQSSLEQIFISMVRESFDEGGALGNFSARVSNGSSSLDEKKQQDRRSLV